MQRDTGGSWNENGIEDEWIACPTCRYPMLPLRTYELQKVSEFPAVEADGWTFFFFGWIIFVAQIAYHFLTGLFTFEARKRKLAQAKRDILPRFPNSIVCPQCINVVKRQ